MLEHTFCHIPSIGVKTESRIWDGGVPNWDHFLSLDPAALGGLGLPSRALSETFREKVMESRIRLNRQDVNHFADRLPSTEQWRLLRHFAHRTCYLDIETTGLGKGQDHITSIAVFDGQTVRTYVHGRNLDDFVKDIQGFDLMVTFNGKCFDAPFIERFFDISLDLAHVDMRFVLKAAGVTGGLKKCEKRFGLDRGHLDGVDGYWAVLLWKEYSYSGDERFLNTLLAYNIEDVLSLQVLAAIAHNILVGKTPVGQALSMDVPELADNPVEPDMEVVEYIRRRYFP